MTCDRCGFENDMSARRCEACGNVLASPERATESLETFRTEPIELPPPPDARPDAPPLVPMPPRPDRWPAIRRILLGLEVLGAVAFGVLAVVDGRYGYLWATVAFGVVPLAYGLAAVVRGTGRPLGIAVALGLVIVLAGSAVAVVTNCDNRLKPGGNLSGCDFSEADLAGLDLSGADLSAAKLSGADLSRANLSDARLDGADLNGAKLTGAKLNGADLTGSDLRDADLAGAIVVGATLARADLRGQDLSGTDLAGLDLSGADLTGTTLIDAVLIGTRLNGALLTDANLDQVSADDADFSGAVLDGATFDQAQLNRVRFDGASLVGTNLGRTGAEETSFEGATMADLVLDGALMTDATGFTDAELAEALGVEESELGSFTAEKFIRLESRFDIMPAMGLACRGRAVPEAAPFRGPGLHPLVLAGPKGGQVDFMSDRPRDLYWEPAALRFGELVACVEPEEQITVEVCQYVTTSGAPGRPTRRVRYRRAVRLLEARTAKVVFERTFEGSQPEACPFSKTSSGTTGEDLLGGSHIDFAVLRPELAKHVR